MVVMMVMVLFLVGQPLLLQCSQLRCQGGLALHGITQLSTGQLAPRRGDDGGYLIVLPEHGNSHIQLLLRNGIGTGQNDGGGGFDLVVIELAKVLHVDLDLACIDHRNSKAQGHVLGSDLLHSGDHIRQLAYTGGLDDDAVRAIFLNDLGQCTAKITHQRATDTTGVHFGNVDACLLQKTAVNTDLAKFILDQHQFLSCVSFADHLFDQRGLACPQKARINIDFCHA